MRKTILFATVVALTLVMLAPPASALGRVLTGGVGSCGDEFGNPGDTYGYTVDDTPNLKNLLGFDVYNECVTYLRLSFSSPDQHLTVVVLDDPRAPWVLTNSKRRGTSRSMTWAASRSNSPGSTCARTRTS